MLVKTVVWILESLLAMVLIGFLFAKVGNFFEKRKAWEVIAYIIIAFISLEISFLVAGPVRYAFAVLLIGALALGMFKGFDLLIDILADHLPCKEVLNKDAG